MVKVQIYDTTLRDGAQAVDINLTAEDKLRIAQKLDDLGIDYIEGGWPGSNPTDKRFFEDIQALSLKHSRIAAFGSTHMAKHAAENDPNLKALAASQAPVITIFGKTWDRHAVEALRVEPERNLELIGNSLAWLRPRCKELFFDAEHFFDGFRANRDYAMECLKRAHQAGADVLVLCDTNGGTLPCDVRKICDHVTKALPLARIGIHAHNDTDMAVANSLMAVQAGAVQVQGTVNGFGERCGNANLCSIIPTLELKLKRQALPKGRLHLITETSRFVDEVANRVPFARQPYVGESAFTHKAGVHVAAVAKDSSLYEHVQPEKVGNLRQVVLSDMSGQANILFKAKEYGITLEKGSPEVLEILREIKEKEAVGYEYSASEASFELLMRRALGMTRRYFSLVKYRVLDWKQTGCEDPLAEATVMVQVGGHVEHTAAVGLGPVNALDNSLRKALVRFYPKISEIRLLDFKVRVLNAKTKHDSGTASHVRVLITTGDQTDTWTTVGVSHNIIQASWQALEDAVNYKLVMEDKKKQQGKC
ncbi:(R)-citramalate synthase [Fundidesulfovibrio magnetotacticus]|uniref:Citramalate synthase n=1 Tax=Fundidesulfovibrio magnetotacticus TaxID=2730080 RepID=A0A6V8LY50_9BACT|nr:citramalate synthase [Fundidesulfovibrio magnetotacticus]GFK95168.1 (R)-citramalate synthase [Fundidesulfovibrio magnetotacticus]